MKKRRLILLRILDSLAILTFVVTFSPFVIPQNQTGPYLLGVPYTMWMGFIVSIGFVILAFLVSVINKEDSHAD